MPTHNGLQTFLCLWILCPIASYFIGALPFGRLITQSVAGIDITQRGSGNIGATNVAREIGIKWGLLTLVLDGFKGFVPVFLFRHFFPQFEIGHAVVGLSALIGHQFSLFQRFRGGKGVATTLGIYLALSPVPCLIALLIFLVVVYIWDYISVGSMVAAFIMPLFIISFGQSDALVVTSLIMAALICMKHKDNIHRLVKGQERRWRKRALK